MKKQRVSMWVAPEFRKAMRQEAADQDTDMITYTKQLAGVIRKKKDDKPHGFI